MKNTNSGSNTDNKKGHLNTETENNKQPDIIMPDEEPVKILPITDDNNEEFNEDDINAGINEVDEMDNSGADDKS